MKSRQERHDSRNVFKDQKCQKLYNNSALTRYEAKKRPSSPKITHCQLATILRESVGQMKGWTRRSLSRSISKFDSSKTGANGTPILEVKSTKYRPQPNDTTLGTINFENRNHLSGRKNRSLAFKNLSTGKNAPSKKNSLFDLACSFANSKPIDQKPRKQYIKNSQQRKRLTSEKTTGRETTSVSTPSTLGDDEFTFSKKGVTEWMRKRRCSQKMTEAELWNPWKENEELYTFSNALLGPFECLSDLLE